MVTVCELIERKRVEDIIEAVCILKQKGYDLKTCIVGDGPLFNSLKQLAMERGLNGNVTFTGYTKDVLSYLRKSKIYVQSSRQEGLSISLIEAMAVGLVPVSTKAGSEEDIITHGQNGFW
ncbi:MAG: glycosyltransferase [Bacteroidales bacterium]|nr:glycosyltransferase [Bacteroidales bacterium]